MVSCIIIEDQPPAQRILQKYIADIGMLDLKGTFGDALSALDFLKNHPTDLIFLDIHLPKLSGIDLLKILSPRPKVILTTAFPDYALQGYELDAVDYLLKPFSFERFVKAVSKVLTTTISVPSTLPTAQTINPSEIIFLKSGNDYVKIDRSNIHYIQSDGDYTFVFTEQGRHISPQPLKTWLEQLPGAHFCQVHKSYIVCIRHIDKVSGNLIYMGKNRIPIGRTYRKQFYSHHLDHLSS